MNQSDLSTRQRGSATLWLWLGHSLPTQAAPPLARSPLPPLSRRLNVRAFFHNVSFSVCCNQPLFFILCSLTQCSHTAVFSSLSLSVCWKSSIFFLLHCSSISLLTTVEGIIFHICLPPFVAAVVCCDKCVYCSHHIDLLVRVTLLVFLFPPSILSLLMSAYSSVFLKGFSLSRFWRL